jgi:hypothetical protein
MEAKEFNLFLGGELDEYETVVGKSGTDAKMLACPGAAEDGGWLWKCLYFTRKMGGSSRLDNVPGGRGTWCAWGQEDDGTNNLGMAVWSTLM